MLIYKNIGFVNWVYIGWLWWTVDILSTRVQILLCNTCSLRTHFSMKSGVEKKIFSYKVHTYKDNGVWENVENSILL